MTDATNQKFQVALDMRKYLTIVTINDMNMYIYFNGDVIAHYSGENIQTKPAKTIPSIPINKDEASIKVNKEDGSQSVTTNGVTIELADDTITVYTNGALRLKSIVANDNVSFKTTPQIGETMEDGTIYAGISPDTDQPMFVQPTDLKMAFNDARKHASQVTDANGRKGFRIPSLTELDALFQIRDQGALQGTFNQNSDSSDSPSIDGYYWTSHGEGNMAYVQNFGRGSKTRGYTTDIMRVRYVR